MTKRSAGTLALLITAGFAQKGLLSGCSAAGSPNQSDTVHVASPTGEEATDRVSILAAINDVRPGGTVQFAPGTYLVGELIRVSKPRVTLLGHSEGTTLRGCNPSAEEELRSACHGLELMGGYQIVRGLTFERTHFGLVIGCCITGPLTGEMPPPVQAGGYLIEENTFRESRVGVRVLGGSPAPTVIRKNAFLNLIHAVGVNGGTVHILDNDIAAPEPDRVPVSKHTLSAIGVVPLAERECGKNIIAGNRIEGHPDGIVVSVRIPGTRCRGNVIRDNMIIVRRVTLAELRQNIRVADESDSTLVGVPIALFNVAGDEPLPAPLANRGYDGEAIIEANLIEGNRVIGADGLGIEIRKASGNRIVGNRITAIELRNPFPGNTANSAPPEVWREANGSAIWISPGSEGNEIVGNIFEDITGPAIFLAGDLNFVQFQDTTDLVRDTGNGNRVFRPDAR